MINNFEIIILISNNTFELNKYSVHIIYNNVFFTDLYLLSIIMSRMKKVYECFGNDDK